MAETLLSASILEAIPDAVAAVNQQGVIIQVNSQTEALFGYTRDELIGQKIEMLVPERQRPQHHLHREQFHAQAEDPAHGVRSGSLRQAARWLGISGRDQPQPRRDGGRQRLF